jgi:hypothetical protein
MCGTNELLRKRASAKDLEPIRHWGALHEIFFFSRPPPGADGPEKDEFFCTCCQKRFASRAAFERHRAERETVLDAMRMLS